MSKHPEGTDYHTVRNSNGERVGKYLSRAGYADGGAVKPAKKADAPPPPKTDGEPDMEPIGKKHGGAVKKKADGGEVSGDAAAPRLDKFARGGNVKHKGKHGKGGTKVNVIVAGGQQGGAPAGPDPKMAFKAGMMAGAKAAAGGAGGPPPGGAPMPPPGAAPGGPPPMSGPAGAPPMMPPPGAKRGGRIAPKMEGGAGSGVGRLDKTEDAKKMLKGMKRGGNC